MPKNMDWNLNFTWASSDFLLMLLPISATPTAKNINRRCSTAQNRSAGSLMLNENWVVIGLRKKYKMMPVTSCTRISIENKMATILSKPEYLPPEKSPVKDLPRLMTTANRTNHLSPEWK